MKKAFIILTLSVCLGLTGCRSSDSGVVQEISSETSTLKQFERHAIGDDYYILVDKNTGVCYLEYRYEIGARWGAYGITIMLDSDGTPVIWEDFNK